ncbi:MAG: FMN-binding protein [Gammaproteobacteria bacterium]|nr:FMN-binding protein [Gammaproteobacteria bacterium]
MSSSQNAGIGKGDPGSATLIATLSFAGLLSGLIIVLAYDSTLPTITAYKATVMKEAVFKVLPGVSRMQRLVYRNGTLSNTEQTKKGDEVIFSGYDISGRLVGYAIPGAGPGFQDTIRLLYGYIPEKRKITGMEILESRETPGLGDKIYKDPAFVANFDSLAVDPEIRAVKKGKRSAANEIDAITGATISSKAVVRIINEANRLWLPRIEQASQPKDKG